MKFDSLNLLCNPPIELFSNSICCGQLGLRWFNWFIYDTLVMVNCLDKFYIEKTDKIFWFAFGLHSSDHRVMVRLYGLFLLEAEKNGFVVIFTESFNLI